MTLDYINAPSSIHESRRGNHVTAVCPDRASSCGTEMPGGADAPARARRWLLAQLPANEIGISSDDVSLIISEVVTNSVTHAGVDASRQLTLSAQPTSGGWRITVCDPGSDAEPHLRTTSAWGAGGFGLQLVERLCTNWGTFRDSQHATHLWFDLPLPGRSQAAPALA